VRPLEESTKRGARLLVVVVEAGGQAGAAQAGQRLLDALGRRQEVDELERAAPRGR